VRSPQGGASNNRRKAPRVRVTSLVGYSQKRDDHIYQTLGTAQALDLSESGLRLRVHEALPVGAELQFEIALGKDLHSVTGRIVWGEELDPDKAYEFGIKFVSIEDDVRAQLRSYVAGRATGS
jgi:hypothetical protein